MATKLQLISIFISLWIASVRCQQDLLKEQFCQYQLKNCPFSSATVGANCVYQFCQGGPYNWGSCVTAGPGSYPGFPGAAATCCASSNAQTCLANIQKGLGSSSGSSTTVTGPCGTVSSIVASCVSASASAYITAPATVKAQCLCYDANSKYVGSVWDNAESSCLQVGSTVFPGWWSAVSSDGANWCANHVPATVAGSSSRSGSSSMSAGGTGTGTGTAGQTSGVAQTATSGQTSSTASATASASNSSAGDRLAPHGFWVQIVSLFEVALVSIVGFVV